MILLLASRIFSSFFAEEILFVIGFSTNTLILLSISFEAKLKCCSGKTHTMDELHRILPDLCQDILKQVEDRL